MEKLNSNIENKPLDLRKVRFEDVKTNMKIVIENICLHSLFQHILLHSLPFFQIYYSFLSFYNPDDSENMELFWTNIFIYGFAFFSLKLIYSFVEYTNEVVMRIFYDLLTNKDYYKMGDVFRKTVFISIFVNLILCFPIILLINWGLREFSILNQINFAKWSDKIYEYHFISFFTICFYSFNKPLHNLLFAFQKFGKINLNILLKFILNITFCKYFNKVGVDGIIGTHSGANFLTGIAFADFISEFVSSLFLVVSMYMSNPYPQAWITVNLRIILNWADFFNFYKDNLILNWRSFISYFCLNYWKEFLFSLYAIFGWLNLTDFSREVTQQVVILILINNLFFSSDKFTNKTLLKEISNYFSGLSIDHRSTNTLKCKLINSNDDFMDMQANRNSHPYSSSKQYGLLKKIKTLIFCCIFINFISFTIFYIFYIFNLFNFLPINILVSNIVISSVNGILNSVTIELSLINTLLENTKFHLLTLVSYVIFTVVYLLILSQLNLFHYTNSLSISFYLANYYLLFKFYDYIQKVDMRVINLQKMEYLKDRDTNK